MCDNNGFGSRCCNRCVGACRKCVSCSLELLLEIVLDSHVSVDIIVVVEQHIVLP